MAWRWLLNWTDFGPFGAKLGRVRHHQWIPDAQFQGQLGPREDGRMVTNGSWISLISGQSEPREGRRLHVKPAWCSACLPAAGTSRLADHIPCSCGIPVVHGPRVGNCWNKPLHIPNYISSLSRLCVAIHSTLNQASLSTRSCQLSKNGYTALFIEPYSLTSLC